MQIDSQEGIDPEGADAMLSEGEDFFECEEDDVDRNLDELVADIHVEERTEQDAVAEELAGPVDDHEGLQYMQFITSDNARNMVLAVQLMDGWVRFPCIAHVTHLAARDALEVDGVGRAVGQVRSIVHHYTKSGPDRTELLDHQRSENVKQPLKLLMDGKTRWNSTLRMLERFRQLYPTLKALAACGKMSPDVSQLLPSAQGELGFLATIDSILALLRPLAEITE